MTEHVPPNWWKPSIASPAELSFYGIPQEPPTALASRSWSDTWSSHYSRSIPVWLCEGSSDSFRYGSIGGGIWAGVVVNGTYHDYSEAFGNITEPGTGDPCPSGTAIYDSWVGLGGYGEYNLMQSGVSVGDPSSPSQAGPDAAFYEVLNSAHSNPPVWVTAYSGGFIGPHDSLNMATQYLSTDSKVHFAWHDLTNGLAASVDVTSAAGSPISAYYSGNSADFVNENVGNTYVRSFDDVPWTNLVVKRNNGSGLAPFSLPHTGLYANQYGGKTIGLNPDYTLTTSSFNEHWFACD